MIDQHASLAEKFLKKGFWLYLFSFIIAPIGYIIKIIISGELSVSEVGILYGVVSLVVLISSFNDFGMRESLNHFIPKYYTEKDFGKIKSILLYTLLVYIVTGISFACLFFFGADMISTHYFKNVAATTALKTFSLFFIGINIFHIISTFFIAIQNTFYNKIVDFFRMFFSLFFVAGVFFLDKSSLLYFSLAWVAGLYAGVLFSLYFFFKKYYFRYFAKEKIIWDKALFFTVLQYALWILLGAQAATILGQMDMQMIIYLLGTQEAGYYTNYLSIIGIPFLLIGPIFGLLFPVFSEMHSKGEIEKIKIIKSVFLKNFIALGLAFIILFFVFSEIIAFILFGEKFIESGVILKYSVLFLLFNFMLQINFNIMAGIGKIKERVKIISLALIFNFFMNLILIHSIGMYGAALATGMGWVIIWLMSEYFLRKDYSVKFDFMFFGKNLLLLGIGGIACFTIIIPVLEPLSRSQAFFAMGGISIVWFTFFAFINLKEGKNFLSEVKKLKH